MHSLDRDSSLYYWRQLQLGEGPLFYLHSIHSLVIGSQILQ